MGIGIGIGFWLGLGIGLGLEIGFGFGLGFGSGLGFGFSEAALEHAAAQVVVALALHRARHDALRHPRLPQREDLAGQSDHVRVGHVLERQPARGGQHAALRLRAKTYCA